MKSIFQIFLVLAAVMLSSCEDVIQIKLDEGSKLYVVDAFVNDLRKDQVIRITTNDSYFSNRSAPPVTGASVVLKDLTSNTAYTFNYQGDGNYIYPITVADTIARAGHQYKLEITLDGQVYTSTANDRRTAKIDSVQVMYNDGTFSEPTKDSTYFCLLYARDKADNDPDYYWIKTYRNDTLFQDPADLNICIDGTGGIVKDAPADSVNFTPSSTFLGFKTYWKNCKVAVEIHSISRETYFFFIQTYNQINNQGLFATTPENVKTNIVSPSEAKTKAIGRFNMATVATYSRIVKP